MPITMLDQVEFNKIPSLNFVAPVVSSDPVVTSADEGRLIYNTAGDTLKYCREVSASPGTYEWVALGAAGAGAPPSGPAGGDLTGTYPNPQILAGAIVDADVNATANIAQSKINGLTTALTAKAATATTATAGAGLTGGGTLGANFTFDVVSANTDMTVGADSITINSAPKWTTGRTITLTGDITGTSAAFDGTAALSFVTAIGAGVIMDADINSAAGIAQSKITNLTTDLTAETVTTTDMIAGSGMTGGGTLAASRTFTIGAGTGITVNADDVALNLTYTDGRYLQVAGGTLTNFLTLHADPTAPMHAVTKQYVDLSSQGFSFKNAARVVSTTNQAVLSGLLTIDGITLVVGNRVLLAAQTTQSQNGIWTAASGAWSRAIDMDANGELVDGTLVPIAEGTSNADSQWMCTSVGAVPWVPGTNVSAWTKYSSVNDLSGGAGLTKTGNTIDIVSATADLLVGADNLTIVSAPKWTTGRTITLTGDVTGTSGGWDGSGNISFAVDNAVGAIVDADVNVTANIAQSKISGLPTALSGKVDTGRSVLAGNGLTGGGALTSDVTLNVIGDANLSVTADLVSVLSAPKWTTARSITLTGDVTGTVAAVDGTANISIATTVVGGAAFAKKYTIDIPAGTANIPIDHNLNTLDVTVEIYQKSNGATVFCDVARSTVNRVLLTFAAAISAAQYRVVVTG